MPRFICAISQFRIHPNAKNSLSYNGYERVAAWLNTWTAEANVKAVIANNMDHAVVRLRAKADNLIPGWLRHESGLTPKDLQFSICFSDLEEDDSFWRKLQTTDGKWYDLFPDQ